MDILLDVTGQVKVDDVFHVGDVQTTCRDLTTTSKDVMNYCGTSDPKFILVGFFILLTAVATRMGHFPDRNWLRASSRSLWERSPWMLVQA